MSKENFDAYIIPREVLDRVFDYLAARPFREVVDLMLPMSTDACQRVELAEYEKCVKDACQGLLLVADVRDQLDPAVKDFESARTALVEAGAVLAESDPHRRSGGGDTSTGAPAHD